MSTKLTQINNKSNRFCTKTNTENMSNTLKNNMKPLKQSTNSIKTNMKKYCGVVFTLSVC